MSDLRDLYQEVILDHSRSPRNFKVLEVATHKSDGYNPLCGDKVITIHSSGHAVYCCFRHPAVEKASFDPDSQG